MILCYIVLISPIKECLTVYNFPVITHIDQVKDAIKRHRPEGKSEFIIAERNGYMVANYMVAMTDTFLPIDDTDPSHDYRKILRECRGKIFDAKTGLPIRTPYHKFFNVGEKEETQVNLIDLSQPHVILQKLDGSLIAPFDIRDGNTCYRIWGTKMGNTDIADTVRSFVNAYDESVGTTDKTYNNFVDIMHSMQMSVMFEWCSRKNRIVIDYPEDMLVVTGARHIMTGQYMAYSTLCDIAANFGIPVVKAWRGTTENMTSLIDHTRGLIDEEGYVIRFDNGHMYKIKAEQYLTYHKAKDVMHLEKNVIKVVVDEGVDDLMPLLSPDDSTRLGKFNNDVMTNITAVAEKFMTIVINEHKNTTSKKEYAQHIINNYPKTIQMFLFSGYTLLDKNTLTLEAMVDMIRKYIADKCGSSTNVESIRHLIGDISWVDYYQNHEDGV